MASKTALCIGLRYGLQASALIASDLRRTHWRSIRDIVPPSPMLRTIDRYVIREVIPPFLLSLLVFTFILEVPPVMQQLETLVSKGVLVAGRRAHHPAADSPGARPDDSDGAPDGPPDRARPAVLRTARRWRSWPAASRPYRLLRPVLVDGDRCRRRDALRDGRGHPGRQPDGSGRSPSTSSPSGSRTTSARASSSRTSRAGSCTRATRRREAAGRT